MSTNVMLVNGTGVPSQPVVLPRRSRFLCRWFAWWVRGYLARHFHAVRLARGTRPAVPADVPLLIVLNHPSWWDPLIGIVLADLFPARAHYVPMDARSLERYGLFKRLGFYGIEPGLFGAAAFLRTTTAILSQPRTAVWITAQGRFADPRTRPAGLRAGVGHVARRLGHAVVVPLALEYPFWDERLPEALARFGQPVHVEPGDDSRAADWVKQIEASLTAAQDALAADAVRRDPTAFVTLVAGKVGGGGVYDRWRRFRTRLRGERFCAGHGLEGGRP